MIDIRKQFRELAAPIQRGEKIQQIVERAAKAADLPYWRAFDFWYGKTKTLTDEEIQRVATALTTKRKRENRNEFHELKMRLAVLESRLVQADEEFHRETVAALRASMCGRG
jgi:K+/H+ antiporter YhaU regulatory subunit KhtT